MFFSPREVEEHLSVSRWHQKIKKHNGIFYQYYEAKRKPFSDQYIIREISYSKIASEPKRELEKRITVKFEGGSFNRDEALAVIRNEERSLAISLDSIGTMCRDMPEKWMSHHHSHHTLDSLSRTFEVISGGRPVIVNNIKFQMRRDVPVKLL